MHPVRTMRFRVSPQRDPGALLHEDRLDKAPPTFKSAAINVRGFPKCVSACSSMSRTARVAACASRPVPLSIRVTLNAAHQSGGKAALIETERTNIRFFESLPANDRARVDFANVRGVQFLQPLFEFSGACAGCGETPYLKLLSQLFGDRLQVANATGLLVIYGANLPVTP